MVQNSTRYIFLEKNNLRKNFTHEVWTRRSLYISHSHRVRDPMASISQIPGGHRRQKTKLQETSQQHKTLLFTSCVQ